MEKHHGGSVQRCKLNIPFLVRLALGAGAPEPIQNAFQTGFLHFARVLLRQKQLQNTVFQGVTIQAKEDFDTWETLCKTWSLERSLIDPDRVVWIAEEFMKRTFIRPGQWVNISRRLEHTVTNKDQDYFKCQVLPFQDSGSGQDELRLTPTTEYNLRIALNILPFQNLPNLRLNPILTDPVLKTVNAPAIFSPILAQSMKLSRLKSDRELNSAELDIFIHDKFILNDKYLSIGDIVSIHVDTHSTVDYVVTGINDKQLDTGQKQLFKVSSASTKVLVEPHEIHNQFGVRSVSKNLLAPCLHEHFTKIDSWIRQALDRLTVHGNDAASRDLWPTFLLHGPIGTGKTSVCQAIARSLGVRYHHINGVNLIGDTSAYTEGKFKAVYDHIRNSWCPAIVHIKNIHLIGKDKDGNEDKRVLLAFKEFLEDIVSHSVTLPANKENPIRSSAVFIIGSTNFADELLPSVAQTCLFKLEFPQAVHISKTSSTLTWLLTQGNVLLEDYFDLDKWTKENCEVMKHAYGDLKALIGTAVRHAFTRHSSTQSDSRLKVGLMDLQNGLEAIDSVLKKSASSVEVPKVSWEDIGGLEDVKKELINSVRLPIEYPHLFAAGIRRSGILLYGPPGTGKTLIAKAVATEFKLSFLSVKGPELLNMYVGQSEQNVRNVFEKARKSAPCIIFFDELDALAPNRGRAGDSGGVMDRVVSQILAELDGTHSTQDVFIIGATNRPDLIDPALLRPGRFDKMLYVGVNQDISSKLNVLKAVTRKFAFKDDVDLISVAGLLPDGMSGADLYSVCSDTYMIAVERHMEQLASGENHDVQVLVSMIDFKMAIEKATVSLSEGDLARYENLKELKR